MTDQQHIVEFFAERQAIMHYEGGLTKLQASYAAYFETRKQFGRGFAIPETIAEEVRLAMEDHRKSRSQPQRT